jgi:hypothetical protein
MPSTTGSNRWPEWHLEYGLLREEKTRLAPIQSSNGTGISSKISME